MKADIGTCLAIGIIVMLIMAFYMNLSQNPKLNSDISNGIKVYILLIANTTRFEDYYSNPIELKTVEWTEQIHDIFFGPPVYDPTEQVMDNRNVDQFFYEYSELHVQVYTDYTDAIYGNEHTIPDSVLSTYLSTITPAQKRIYESCNILWILFSNRTSFINGGFMEACVWGSNAESFFWGGLETQKHTIAHEICHWLGASDKYHGTSGYNPIDPDTPYDIMSDSTWTSQLIIGNRTLQEISQFTHNWTIIP